MLIFQITLFCVFGRFLHAPRGAPRFPLLIYFTLCSSGLMMSTYWWERSIVGATMDKLWEELRTHFHGGKLGVFHSWHCSLRWSHPLGSKGQHFKFITVAPGGETGCVLQGISACHEKCSLDICKELNGLMSLPWAWLRKWLFSKKIRSEYCSMGCFLYLLPWIIYQKAFSNSEQHK